MSYGTFMKFHHTVDIYWKQSNTTPAGQKLHSFEYKDTLPCLASWQSSQNVNNPYIANIDELTLYIPKDFTKYINYVLRFKNVKDRYSENIDSSFFDVTAINKKMQYNGKVHHYVITLRKVVETGD